jgi:hypothetical protein
MTRLTHVTQPTEECRWSVPACRPNPMADRADEFESFWECERGGAPRRVTQAECSGCVHWVPEHGGVTETDRAVHPTRP